VSSRRDKRNPRPNPHAPDQRPDALTDGCGKSSPNKLQIVPTATEVLLERIKRRDRQALSELFDKCAEKVCAIAFGQLREPQRADQLVQDVFFIVWTHSNWFDPSREDAVNWLLRITYWCCYEQRSQRQLSSQALYDAFSNEFRRAPGGHAASAFDKLPEIHRRVLALYYFGGMTLTEISQALSRPIDTIRKQYWLGLTAMTANPADTLATSDALSALEREATPDPVGP